MRAWSFWVRAGESNPSGPESIYGIYECVDKVATFGLGQPFNHRALDFGQVAMFGSAADVPAFTATERTRLGAGATIGGLSGGPLVPVSEAPRQDFDVG